MRHTPQPGAALYRVRVAGHVARHWLAWISRLAVTWEQGGTTLIECACPDQAALHGLLARIRDLGLTLLSVERAPAPAGPAHADAAEAPAGAPAPHSPASRTQQKESAS